MLLLLLLQALVLNPNILYISNIFINHLNKIKKLNKKMFVLQCSFLCSWPPSLSILKNYTGDFFSKELYSHAPAQ
jgi:hypothetical protein